MNHRTPRTIVIHRPFPHLVGVAVAIVSLAIILALTACGASSPAATPADATVRSERPVAGPSSSEPGPVTAATVSSEPSAAESWSVLRPTTAVAVHESPEAETPVRTVEARTSFGSPTALLVVDEVDGWYEVLVPGRPSGMTGWVPAGSGEVKAVRTEIRIDLEAATLTLFEDGRSVVEAPIALGAADTPTPTGRFSVTDKLAAPNPDGAYGPFALGLSGRSEVVTEFAGGDGQIGIHGTNDPSSIGRPVSHGCVRVANDVIDELNERVPLGTPVLIV